MNFFDTYNMPNLTPSQLMTLGGLLGPKMVQDVNFGNQVPATTTPPPMPVLPMGMMGPNNLTIDNANGPRNIMPGNFPGTGASGGNLAAAAGLLAPMVGGGDPGDQFADPRLRMAPPAGISRMNPIALQMLPGYGMLRR